MAALPIIMAAAAVVSAVGAIKQGQAAESAANFNAQVASQNADISRANAQAQAQQQQREMYLRLGSIRAAQGKSGGDAGSGSVLDVLGDTAAQGELEKQNILYQGELQARGFNNTAGLDRFSGEQAVSSSYFKAGSELLSGAAGYYKAGTQLSRTN